MTIGTRFIETLLIQFGLNAQDNLRSNQYYNNIHLRHKTYLYSLCICKALHLDGLQRRDSLSPTTKQT